jgi:hypothetical protein
VQVDPMKPKLNPPGTKRLKLNCDTLLSSYAFKVDLRRYIEESGDATRVDLKACKAKATAEVQVGRCWLTPGSPQVHPSFTPG